MPLEKSLDNIAMADQIVSDFVSKDDLAELCALQAREGSSIIAHENKQTKIFKEKEEVLAAAIRFAFRNITENNYNDSTHTLYDLCVHDFRRWSYIYMAIKQKMDLL